MERKVVVKKLQRWLAGGVFDGDLQLPEVFPRFVVVVKSERDGDYDTRTIYGSFSDIPGPNVIRHSEGLRGVYKYFNPDNLASVEELMEHQGLTKEAAEAEVERQGRKNYHMVQNEGVTWEARIFSVQVFIDLGDIVDNFVKIHESPLPEENSGSYELMYKEGNSEIAGELVPGIENAIKETRKKLAKLAEFAKLPADEVFNQ